MSLVKLATGSLTKKQKNLLLLINTLNNGSTITSLVREISQRLNCPRSTVWYNVKVLEKSGLIECGSGGNKNIPTKITTLGKIILKNLRGL